MRRGSATGIASPREIAMMGAANTARGEAQVLLSFQTPENGPLPYTFEREFLVFPEDLPDLVGDRSPMLYLSGQHINEDYWRDGAYYHSSWRRAVQVRLLLANQSNFSLGDAHLEVTCRCPDGNLVVLLRADCMPEKPESSYFSKLATNLDYADQRVSIDERGSEPVAHVSLGTIRPGQTVRAEEDLAFLVAGPGSYLLQVRILANEIPAPLLIEHQFDVEGPVTKLSESDLTTLMSSSFDESED